MPTHQGQDARGKYYQWGNQKKYYYNNKASRKLAKKKAIRQGIAIQMHQGRSRENWQAGGNDGDTYKDKYIKYKTKYLMLSRANQ